MLEGQGSRKTNTLYVILSICSVLSHFAKLISFDHKIIREKRLSDSPPRTLYEIFIKMNVDDKKDVSKKIFFPLNKCIIKKFTAPGSLGPHTNFMQCRA